MTLGEQVVKMVADGAVIGWGPPYPKTAIPGWVQVDEDNKRLYYMRRWPDGTGDVHVFTWESYDQNEHFVNFYQPKGVLKANIGRTIEFSEIDPVADRIDRIAWQKEFAQKRADYLEFFQHQIDELKDSTD